VEDDMNVVNVRQFGGRVQAERNGVVYAGRPSIFGNPFVLADEAARGSTIEQYRKWLWQQVAADTAVAKAIRALPADATLGCWCKPHACHCDVIVRCWEWMHEAK
jgi:hypothetical protein